MPINLDEILQCEERLQGEIAERECLLAAVKVMRGYAEKGRSLKGLEVGALGQALLAPGANKMLTLEAPAPEKQRDAVVAPPALPQPKPYIHPELEKLSRRNLYGRDTMMVHWAIDRMTGDFTLQDIGGLLQREGYALPHAKISVVLTRLQRTHGLKVIRFGRGPLPTLFRNPNPPAIANAGANGASSSTEEAVVPTAA